MHGTAGNPQRSQKPSRQRVVSRAPQVARPFNVAHRVSSSGRPYRLAMADWNQREDFDDLRASIGRVEALLRAGALPGDLRSAEFKTFSQWNEDGIVQHLIHHVPIDNPTFIEFGVEDYRESNTRFLLVNNGWRGLIVDGGEAHQKFVYEESTLGWRYPDRCPPRVRHARNDQRHLSRRRDRR
jgi:hypothetical protein